jgi:hypothetical protein
MGYVLAGAATMRRRRQKRLCHASAGRQQSNKGTYLLVLAAFIYTNNSNSEADMDHAAESK